MRQAVIRSLNFQALTMKRRVERGHELIFEFARATLPLDKLVDRLVLV
eukprot:CAMPEP_0175891654 /NCGR_PEP_ID=MMETSP0107_2-20121207/48498_1 /TAXON_ID=195067 ORGANISM="Goniomonas pacifica, Strain CCMP1869" /NCGR_SAMPLE_ID=MMETSP0107_2 /ASSEMBLY_ACC=CAM_ASM_000203 /LENGTH=47 /DNA_ID= /DNA_START= /DNA_END= /DNA_ORIENTATION=